MKPRVWIFASLVLAAVLISGWFARNSKEAAGKPPGPAIPTFSTAEIGREGRFYVGGHYVGEPGNETMHGAMYVETWVPKNIRHPYPIVFIAWSVGQGEYELMQTPDGRPGWAYDFVNQGYTVYMMDFPGLGRSGFIPGVDGTPTPQRSTNLIEEIWTGGRSPSSDWSKEQHIREHRVQEFADWPQWKKETQWPGEGPNKGKKGDPAFDYYAKMEVHGVSGFNLEGKDTLDDIVQLLDMIGKPVILLLHSGSAVGWLVADARPHLVKAILAPEPNSPPIENAERGLTGPGNVWGPTRSFIHYDPPISDPSQLHPVRQEKADGPDLLPCWIQQEPAHKLINLESIPVLNVTGEASYHRPYAHCEAKWLNQAGVKTTFVRLEDVGLPGNGHQMMSEKNSAEIAKFFMSWLDKNVH
jgi:pimeloyl-ACP methyl ester carboxylesterase